MFIRWSFSSLFLISRSVQGLSTVRLKRQNQTRYCTCYDGSKRKKAFSYKQMLFSRMERKPFLSLHRCWYQRTSWQISREAENDQAYHDLRSQTLKKTHTHSLMDLKETHSPVHQSSVGSIQFSTKMRLKSAFKKHKYCAQHCSNALTLMSQQHAESPL